MGSDDDDKLIKQIFEAKIVNKKRERARKTLIEEVRIATEKRGTKWVNVKIMTKNRSKQKENSTPI